MSRGTFIEYRSCMLNICPIGRSATKEQRDQFEILDKEKQIRKSIDGRSFWYAEHSVVASKSFWCSGLLYQRPCWETLPGLHSENSEGNHHHG